MLTITDLPADIHDNIAAFLPDKDLIDFVCASRHIGVSAYLLRQRQRAFWKKSGVKHLAETGDLAGLQYLHGLGFKMTEEEYDGEDDIDREMMNIYAMDEAALLWALGHGAVFA